MGMGLRIQCRFRISRYRQVSNFLVLVEYTQLVSITSVASSDHVARLWEMASGETVRQYNGHHKGNSHFQLCSD